ncbi:MAG TPA: hypothetical protein DE310_02410 [Alphaproteobacteria bacterium]|nr:hypothetical protein [Alphaproteobacteria bacterium]|tara:strand:- start:2889 stop:3146 length:258 start_codon:yes stop_codon:yes gene_type:complete
MTKRYPRQWPFAKQNIHLFQKSEIQPATGLQNRMNLQMSGKFQQQIADQHDSVFGKTGCALPSLMLARAYLAFEEPASYSLNVAG